jgi:hypothetical protein
MSKVLLALTSVALLGLTGCAGTPTAAMDSKPAASASAISPEAQAALSAAQAAVKDVKSKNVEWTTSDSARKAAEEAAAKGDSATVVKQAKWASDQAKLALGQMNYPVLKVGD